MTEWRLICEKHGISCSDKFSISSTLGDTIETRSCHMEGLPIDTYSIENALIINHSKKWPLMIDPQGNLINTKQIL